MGISTGLQALIFYAVIILFIYLNRSKFEFQGKVVALLRTKFGIRFMHWCGDKFRGYLKVWGYVGIGVGFAGMVFIMYMLYDGVRNLLFVPDAPPTFSPVIPGVAIPGSPIVVPFWYGIIAIFIVVIIHEFSHGVVASAHKFPIKHSGFAWFVLLPAAFVEFNEKKLRANHKVNLSVSAAGPFSNILLTLLLALFFGFLPVFAQGLDLTNGSHLYSEGLQEFSDNIVIFDYYKFSGETEIITAFIMNATPGLPADQAGLPNNTVITEINGISGESDNKAFIETLSTLTPGQEVSLGDGTQSWTLTTTTHPQDETRGYLGVILVPQTRPNYELRSEMGAWAFETHKIIAPQLFWIILLSLGIGLANLMPALPLDGGRMILVVYEKLFKKKTAEKVWIKTTAIIWIIVLLLIIVPIVRSIFSI